MRRSVIAAIIAIAAFSSTACAQSGVNGPINTGTLLQRLYGLTNAPNCYAQTLNLTTSAARVLPNKAARANVCFFNPGFIDAWVWFDATVSTTKGIHLSAGGGFACLDFRTDLLLPISEFWAVDAASTTSIYESECDVQ